MSNIRVDVGYTIHDGSELKFRSPVDCSAITGLVVYYPGSDGNITSKVFALADAHGNNVGNIDHLFAENVVVKVILDVTTGMAFVQNADTNAYLETRIKKAAPVNLLDNSDFRNPVNQRGQTSYTGTSYKIDRWASYYTNSELTINPGYISVKSNGIYQIVLGCSGVYSAFACRMNGEIVTLTAQKNSNGTITVFLPIGDWVWAALYEGEYTAETIPEYRPKGYARELLECQRYYVEIDHYALGTGYSGIGNDVTIFLQTPIQMRTVPTIICDGAIRARYGGTEYYTLDSCRIDAFDRGYSATIRLVGIAISGITSFQVVAGYATSKFALSADL